MSIGKRKFNNDLEFSIARPDQASAVVAFLSAHKEAIESSAPSGEFTCESGNRAAVQRQEVLIAMLNGSVVAAARFYRRRRADRISLYQFAVCEGLRGHGILQGLLSLLGGDTPIDAKCKADAVINEYFSSAGWVETAHYTGHRVWTLSPPYISQSR